MRSSISMHRFTQEESLQNEEPQSSQWDQTECCFEVPKNTLFRSRAGILFQLAFLFEKNYLCENKEEKLLKTVVGFG